MRGAPGNHRRTGGGAATVRRISSSKKRVALLIETSNAYSRKLLHGIWKWCRENDTWVIHLSEQGRANQPPPWLATWKGHGIIARIETSAIEKAVRATGLPVVNVSAAGLAGDVPTIVSDSSALMRMAIEHLTERGFKNLAFCGDARLPWSNKHQGNFKRLATSLGFEAHLFPSHPDDFGNWNLEWRKLVGWVKALPKPAGVVACYDIRGQNVLDACREAGIEVPGDIAVIGQHNDELLCELCLPPLSSVMPDAVTAGWQAAAMLDRLMRGQSPREQLVEIQPIGVATRQSTDVLALEDIRLARAVRFIRENACRPVGVPDVMRVAGISRTLLERHFKKQLGRSPYNEIMRVRMQRAVELLATSELSVAQIAEMTGFQSQAHFSTTVTQQTGKSPRAHRTRNRQSMSA